MRNSDIPAMPVPDNLEGYYADPETCKIFMPFTGLTKREYFAGLAMQGLLSDLVNAEAKGYDVTADQTAREAVMQADALLAALEDDK